MLQTKKGCLLWTAHSPHRQQRAIGLAHLIRGSRFIGQIEGMSSSPEMVAGVILHALTNRNPRARYVATPDARVMLAVMLRMSDGMRDAVWSRMLDMKESPGT
jgi:hypothetical protein